jgi:mannose-6-phosphate isomerase-like protein (cupin superfamily)
MRRIYGKTDGEERHAHDGYPRTVRLLIEPATAGAAHLAMGTEAVDPGSRIPVHVHADTEEVLFLYAGHGRARVGDEEVEVGPETAIFVPAGAPHGFVNTGAAPACLTWTFSPPGAHEKFRDETVWKHGRREPR